MLSDAQAQAVVAAAVAKTAGDIKNLKKGELERNYLYPVTFAVVGKVQGYGRLIQFGGAGKVEREADDETNSKPTGQRILEALRLVVSRRRWSRIVSDLVDGLAIEGKPTKEEKDDVERLLARITTKKPLAGAVKFRPES